MNMFDTDPHSYTWVGGVHAGYAILSSQGDELWRVWSEGNAMQTVEYGWSEPQWLVNCSNED